MSTERQEVVAVDAILDGLESPSSTDVVLATIEHSERSIAAVAAKRALSSGGGSQPITSGPGSPVGVVTPTERGSVFIQTTDAGALWIAIGETSADWAAVGGVALTAAPGAQVTDNGDAQLQAAAGRSASLTDLDSASNTGNGIYWNGGNGSAYVETGDEGQFVTKIADANGTMTVADGGLIFPTADPHIAGAWWDNAGTLTKSAG